jgi:hypothetical protein
LEGVVVCALQDLALPVMALSAIILMSAPRPSIHVEPTRPAKIPLEVTPASVMRGIDPPIMGPANPLVTSIPSSWETGSALHALVQFLLWSSTISAMLAGIVKLLVILLAAKNVTIVGFVRTGRKHAATKRRGNGLVVVMMLTVRILSLRSTWVLNKNRRDINSKR